MATKWSTTVDPVEWSVDEVVSFLCDPTDTPWLPSSKSPRPDSTKLEAALRANDVCGEILLALDLETTKSLGLESLGQRMTLMKAITWLKAQKSKELEEEPVDRLPQSPQTTVANAISPEPVNKPPKKIPRRIATTIVTEVPPEANMDKVVEQDSKEFQKGGTREDAFYQRLLQHWPPEPVDGDSANLGLELYGDSDSEEELDPETWREVLLENPRLQSTFGKPEPGSTGDSKVLSREICENVIQFHIVSQEHAWCQKNLTGLSSQLDPLWSDLRASNQVDAKKAEIETSVAALKARLEKLKGAHLHGKFKSTKQLQKLCGSLDPTISFLSEERWALKLISTENPPSKVALEHFEEISLEPPKPGDFGLEEDSEGQTDSESELGGESLDSELEDDNDNPSHGSVDTAPFEIELTPHSETNTETVKSTTSESSDLIALEDPFEDLEERSFTSLEQEQNRHDILAKLIMDLDEEEIHEIAGLLDDLLPFIFLERAQRGLDAMLNNRKINLAKDSELKSFMRVSALYLAWHTCRGISDIGIDKKLLADTLKSLGSGDESPEFNEFFDELNSLIQARKKQTNGTSRSNSQNTMQAQPEADTDPLIVSSKNPQAPILLNSEIAKYIKPHQLEGIQFMWRELCESETPQGCLLAHDMGLGKSMQVITLLVTIAESRQSPDPRVWDQVPPGLREGRTLIICSAALVQNWLDELKRWLPENEQLGGVFSISTSTKNRNTNRKESEGHQRYRLIDEWSRRNGVLVMSYDMFRGMISNPSRGDMPMYSDKEHKQLKKILLRRTNIVVADEAHKLSSTSKVSECARLFETEYRIAMTGTPLSNNLTEWFHMIDWISPGYLGDFNEFKAKFVSKIEKGMDADCNKTDRRNGLKAQRLLIGILSPKYHRIEISAIASELPPKTEYAISIRLADVQERVYNAFVSEAQKTPGLSTLSWLSLLQLCCNHPGPFSEQLRERWKKQNSANDTPPSRPTSSRTFRPSLEFVEQVESTLVQAADNPRIPLSFRAYLLEEILKGSAQAGDKVLIFSQSIPTVDWLEGILKQLKTKFCRIDGDSDSLERQTMSRNFNSGDDVQAMLISTKAGGVGLNLYGANRVVIFDCMFNPMWENQAVGRAYRMGQRKPVYVYRFHSSGTFEDLLYDQALSKTELFHTIVNKKDVSTKGGKSKTDWLFSVRHKEQQPIDHIVGNDPHVFDNIAAGRLVSTIVAAELYDFKEEDPQLTEEEQKEVELELVADATRRASARIAARQAAQAARQM